MVAIKFVPTDLVHFNAPVEKVFDWHQMVKRVKISMNALNKNLVIEPMDFVKTLLGVINVLVKLDTNYYQMKRRAEVRLNTVNL